MKTETTTQAEPEEEKPEQPEVETIELEDGTVIPRACGECD